MHIYTGAQDMGIERERGGTYEGTTVAPREAKDLEMDWTVWRMLGPIWRLSHFRFFHSLSVFCHVSTCWGRVILAYG